MSIPLDQLGLIHEAQRQNSQQYQAPPDGKFAELLESQMAYLNVGLDAMDKRQANAEKKIHATELQIKQTIERIENAQQQVASLSKSYIDQMGEMAQRIAKQQQEFMLEQLKAIEARNAAQLEAFKISVVDMQSRQLQVMMDSQAAFRAEVKRDNPAIPIKKRSATLKSPIPASSVVSQSTVTSRSTLKPK